MFAKSASCGLHRKKTKALSFCLFVFGTAWWSHAFCCVMASMQGKEGNAPYFDSFLFLHGHLVITGCICTRRKGTTYMRNDEIS